MKLLILGCGQAGLKIAGIAKGLGWDVTGTTTTPGRRSGTSGARGEAIAGQRPSVSPWLSNR